MVLLELPEPQPSPRRGLLQRANDSLIVRRPPPRKLSKLEPRLLGGCRGNEALYDQFAIGWNEIFDQDAHSASAAAMAPPVVAPTPRASTNVAPAAAAAAAVAAFEETPAAFLPISPRSSALAAAPAPQPEEPSWATETFNAKKLPAYMRVPGGKQSAIDRGMRDKLLVCPTSQVRKPAEVMERELDTLRASVTETLRAKRREVRQARRLQRRCRVRPDEDLDQLLERYPPERYLRPMPDPVEHALTARESARPLAKDFFGSLQRRHRAPTPPPVVHNVAWRVGGAVSHRVG
mmetsp:Transcript_120338/g.376462  ORF Transcript_120338/g.376462 Transcript_120338/m.376462 type:complete len:292 (+) Transcript_120338:301-1176(+)